MPRILECIRELRKITEWKDGCVWKTEDLGLVWIPLGLTKIQENEKAVELGGDFLAVVDYNDPRLENHKMIRSRRIEE